MNIATRLRSRVAAGAGLVPASVAAVLACWSLSGPAGPGSMIPADQAAAPGLAATAGRVLLRVPDGLATVTLDDTSAARAFAAMLPLRLALRDRMGQAKSGQLPHRIDVSDADRVIDPAVGVIYYWPPSGDIAIFYAPSGQARIDVFDNNVLSAHNLMQAAGDLGVSRVVYASSEMATGLLTDGTVPTQIPFDETERHPSPNAYALSKYISEVIADSLAVRYPQTAWVGLRINNVIPPDSYEQFSEEWKDPGRSKANFWSYIDARDVGTAYRAALEGTSSGHEVCLIAAADTRAKGGLRELMAEFYDGYDRFASDYEDPRSAFDCTKMKTLFDWTPRYSWRSQ